MTSDEDDDEPMPKKKTKQSTAAGKSHILLSHIFSTNIDIFCSTMFACDWPILILDCSTERSRLFTMQSPVV